MSAAPRLRVFAGPNGSGKSTIRPFLPAGLLGTYVNPDEIEQALRRDRRFVPSDFGLATDVPALIDFLGQTEVLKRGGLVPITAAAQPSDGGVTFERDSIDAYLASALAGFVRQELLTRRLSFTFETVMSSPDKVQFLAAARSAGYRTYLYYIATEDPVINLARVRNRVRLGGHPVPDEKIETRYHRSLDLLFSAIKQTNRAYMFDNSGDGSEPTWFAEITDGELLELKSDKVPAWFKRAVMDKISRIA